MTPERPPLGTSPKGPDGGSPEGAPTFSLSRAQRVRRRADFVRLQASAVKVTTPHFVLLLGRTPASATSPPYRARLGLVASKKVGCSVERNRIKRLVREAFRARTIAWPPGLDVVVIARTGAGDLSLAQVVDEWRRVSGLLLKRAAEALARVDPGAHGASRPR